MQVRGSRAVGRRVSPAQTNPRRATTGPEPPGGTRTLLCERLSKGERVSKGKANLQGRPRSKKVKSVPVLLADHGQAMAAG